MSFVHTGNPAMERPKIGVSACFLHPDPERRVFASKTLQYLEISVAHWIMAGGALPVLIPSTPGDSDTARGGVALADYARWLDGIVLHGGADLWPGNYGEQPLRPEWSGDSVRDAYEIALLKAFVAAGKPVFGICRGLQLINVAYGGSLYQDVGTQNPGAVQHYDSLMYDRLFHALHIEPQSRLARLLSPSANCRVNSVHHQAIKNLAAGFTVEARCPDDGTIEAIRHEGDPWIAAVQWHPEFHRPDREAINDAPMLADFLAAAQAARQS